MALFTDEYVSDISDLLAYESNLSEVSAAEGIDLEAKIRLAQVEVGASLEATSQRPGNVYFSNGGGSQSSGGEANQGRFNLSQVVVTPPLKLLHTFQTLSIVYRDAYNRKLNDRYLPKWREYKELSRWAWDLLTQTGIGISLTPLPRPSEPALDWTAASLDLGPMFVRMTWTDAAARESAGSVEQAIAVPEGNALRVTPPSAAPGATGWNVYAGESSGAVTRQNATPLALGSAWVMPPPGVIAGEPLGTGQQADLFKTAPRFVQRG